MEAFFCSFDFFFFVNVVVMISDRFFMRSRDHGFICMYVYVELCAYCYSFICCFDALMYIRLVL